MKLLFAASQIGEAVGSVGWYLTAGWGRRCGMRWRGAAVSVVLLTRSSGSLGRLTLLQPLAGRPSGPGSPSGPRREAPPRPCLRR